MQDMISELRNRRNGSPITTTNERDRESSTESGEGVTPISGDGEESQDASPTLIAFNRLLGGFRQQFQAKKKEPQAIRRGHERVKQSKLEDHVRGIPRFAALQNSNDSFSMFRRFGPVATRILINKEIELGQLTAELHELDEAYYADEANKRWRLSSVEYWEGLDPAQRLLLQKIEIKLGEYYDFYIKYAKIKAFDKAQPRHHESILEWVITRGPIYEDEQGFLFHRDDFMTTKKSPGTGNQSSRFHDWVESRLAKKRPESRFNRLFGARIETDDEGEGSRVVHLSATHIHVAEIVIAALLGITAMLPPVFSLFLGGLSPGMMVVIVGCFVLVHLAVMCTVVKVTPHDVFLIIIAYSAVLVTLLSNCSLANGKGSA